MAIVANSVGERPGRRSASEAADGTRTHQRVFFGRTDAATDHDDVILASSNLPQKGDTHPADFNAVVNERTAREISKGYWEIDIAYRPRDPAEPPDSQDGSSKWLQKDPLISVSFQSKLVPANAELSDGMQYYNLGEGEGARLWRTIGVTNAAGEPFDPPPMRQQSFPVITITRYAKEFDAEWSQQYVDSVNDGDIVIAGFKLPPRCGMMMGISTSGVQWETFEEEQFFYFPITFTIHVNMETFDMVLLEHGTFYIDASDGNKRKAFLTEEGQPRLGLLTEDGDDNTGNDPVFKVLDNLYRQEDWGALSLPTTMLPSLAGGAEADLLGTWAWAFDK